MSVFRNLVCWSLVVCSNTTLLKLQTVVFIFFQIPRFEIGGAAYLWMRLIHGRLRYTNHGLKYEPIALEQYQKYLSSINQLVKVFKSGLVISMDAPYLGASPNAKVIDCGCSDRFGLSEVKCPETKYLVTPWMHALIAAFLWKKSMESLKLNTLISTMSKCNGWWVWPGQNGVISSSTPVKEWASCEFHLTLNFGTV